MIEEPSMFLVRAACTSMALVAGFALAAAGCRAPAATARQRVLASLPGDASLVIIAEGAALAHPRVHGALDVLASRWPASLGCVIDAALASEAVGIAVDPASNLTVVLALPRAQPCPALSQRASGLWIATVGEGPASGGASVAAAPRFARARPYLETAPIAAAVLGEVRLIGAAAPDPFEAWLAIDAPARADAAGPAARPAVDQAVDAYLARLGSAAPSPGLAPRIRTTRTDPTQRILRLSGLSDAELAAAVRTLLAWQDGWADRASTSGPGFACPAATARVTCAGGTHYRVASLALDLLPIVAAGPTPVVVSGAVVGLRLDGQVPVLGLARGDVVVAMDGRLVTSRTMLARWIALARGAATVTIRRGGREATLEFAEH